MTLGLASLVAMCLVYVAMIAAPISKASAGEFCSGVTLAPYGAYGDRCYAWEWEAHAHLAVVTIQTHERAGCVTTAAGNSYDLKESWLCAAKESVIMRYVTNTSEPRRGVIRNNNLSYSGVFTGTQTCCWNS
jgi:hypothetical protein